MFKPGLGTLKGYKAKIIYIIVEARHSLVFAQSLHLSYAQSSIQTLGLTAHRFYWPYGRQMILVIIQSKSTPYKWIEVIPMITATSELTIRHIHQSCLLGLAFLNPLYISDNVAPSLLQRNFTTLSCSRPFPVTH